MPVRRIDVKEDTAPPEAWDKTDYIVVLFGLSVPALAIWIVLAMH